MSPIQQLIVVQLVSILWSGTGGPVFESWEALFFISTWDLHGGACGSLVALLHARSLHALAWRCARSRLGVCMHPLPRFFPLALVRLLADALSAALFFPLELVRLLAGYFPSFGAHRALSRSDGSITGLQY